MIETTREQRLRREHAAMASLEAASTVLEFQAEGDPPERYVVTFRGKGLERDAATNQVREIDEHQFEVRFSSSFPLSPPDIRWRTPIFHPNISYGGFIRLGDIGLPWEQGLMLDVICERLWDMARLAYVNAERVSNHTANRWLADGCPFELPIDWRPLRVAAAHRSSNVVHYQRREGQPIVLPPPSSAEEILYIDENTPLPPLLPQRRVRQDDGDVFYIGDE